MMAEAFSLSYCSSTLALESELSRRPEAQYGLVPRLRHHEWKNRKNIFSVMLVGYAQPFFSEAGFFFFQIEILKG